MRKSSAPTSPKFELRKRNASLKHLHEIAKAFHVGIASLFLND
jgi:hypothetical protein